MKIFSPSDLIPTGWYDASLTVRDVFGSIWIPNKVGFTWWKRALLKVGINRCNALKMEVELKP